MSHSALCAIHQYGGDVCTCEIEASLPHIPTTPNDLVMTSKLGTFIFDRNTVLSKAKLIRDAITGQYFCPKPNEPRITNEKSAHNYALHQLDKNLAEISFELRINPQYVKFRF